MLDTFGTNTFSQSVVQIGSAGGTIVAANANRRYLAIQHVGAAGSLWLQFGTALPTALESVIVTPSNSFQMTMGAGNVYTGPVTGKATNQGAGSIPVAVVQGTVRIMGT